MDDNKHKGPEDVATDPASMAAMTHDDRISYLASLSPIEFDKVRVEQSTKMGCRPGTLDKLVAQARAELAAKEQAESGLIQDDEPHGDPVDGAVLLREIVGILRRYAILPQGAEVAIALWIVGSYGYDNFRIFPKLLLSSPEKRCGKSTLLEIVRSLSHRALMASNITPSAIFRCIDAWKPTLLIDEADTFVHGNEELRGIINSGHTKSTAYVIRVVGDDFEPKQFSTWAPMVLAMIKTPPDTILDRCITIPMRRKLPGETITRLPVDFPGECRTLRAKCLRWAQDHAAKLRDAQPRLPASSNDRALDNWTPLLAIAEAVGGRGAESALHSFDMLNRDGMEDDGIGPMILHDLRDIFDGAEGGPRYEKLFGSEIAERLAGLEERPWAEWRHGKPITPTSLARLLKPFGIQSQRISIGPDRQRGYERGWFEDAFKRYLHTPPQESVQVSKPKHGAASSDFQSVHQSGQDTFKVSKPSPPDQHHGHFKASMDTSRTGEKPLKATAGAGSDTWTLSEGVSSDAHVMDGDRI